MPYPQNEAPSQRFRFEQYIPVLKENGYQIHFAPFLDLNTWSALYKEGGFFKKLTGILKSFLRDLKYLLLKIVNFVNRKLLCIYYSKNQLH